MNKQVINGPNCSAYLNEGHKKHWFPLLSSSLCFQIVKTEEANDYIPNENVDSSDSSTAPMVEKDKDLLDPNFTG